MTRTTLTLEDNLLERLKKQALEQKVSLSAVVNDLLHRAMLARETRERNTKLASEWKTFKSGKPKVDINDRDALYDVMDGMG